MQSIMRSSVTHRHVPHCLFQKLSADHFYTSCVISTFLQNTMASEGNNNATYSNREVSLAPATLGKVDDSAAVARYVDVDAPDYR